MTEGHLKSHISAQFMTNLNCNEQADVVIFQSYLARSLREPPILVFEIVVSITQPVD